MVHVLIVDDEVNIRKVLAAMLKREGYEVTTAGDGEQALAAMQRAAIDVVVTDLVMPRLGGLELLKRLSADYPDVPVIFITAHGTVDSAVAALKAGAFDYITKPSTRRSSRRSSPRRRAPTTSSAATSTAREPRETDPRWSASRRR